MPTSFANHDDDATARAPEVESIRAVTLVTADMARAVRFYEALGFRRLFGSSESSFTSFAVGAVNFLNLEARPDAAVTKEKPPRRWGRVIFYVSDVDAFFEGAVGSGLSPESPPRDAEWAERYFHLTDPDGHELSFARPLRGSRRLAPG